MSRNHVCLEITVEDKESKFVRLFFELTTSVQAILDEIASRIELDNGLDDYILAFVTGNHRIFLEREKQIFEYGIRPKSQCVLTSKIAPLSVQLPDSSVRSIMAPRNATVGEILKLVAKKTQLSQDLLEDYSLKAVSIDTGSSIILSTEFTLAWQNISTDSHLYLTRHTYTKDIDALELSQRQAALHFLECKKSISNGYIYVPVAEVAIRLGALSVQIALGDCDSEKEMHVRSRQYDLTQDISPFYINKHDTFDRIIAAWSKLNGQSPVDCQINYIDMVHKLPDYGKTLFFVNSIEDDVAKPVLVEIKKEGVSILNCLNYVTEAFYSYDQIDRFMYELNGFSFTALKKTYFFNTYSAESLYYTLRKYLDVLKHNRFDLETDLSKLFHAMEQQTDEMDTLKKESEESEKEKEELKNENEELKKRLEEMEARINELPTKEELDEKMEKLRKKEELLDYRQDKMQDERRALQKLADDLRKKYGRVGLVKDVLVPFFENEAGEKSVMDKNIRIKHDEQGRITNVEVELEEGEEESKEEQ
ncbi:hypothetical protein PCE1_002021 [Barthelona sp. PCE]